MNIELLIAAFFLPLFPFSMIFNQLLARLPGAPARAALLLLWPQPGVLLLNWHGTDIPDAFVIWAALSALFYGFRALALREAGQWTGFIATSAFSLLWLSDARALVLHAEALVFSLPFVLLCLLAGTIVARFGAAHTAGAGGLAATTPRLATLFVLAMLAAIATPIFPGFFGMLALVVGQVASAPGMQLALLAVWLLWTWSAARLFQGLVIGPARQADVADLSLSATLVYAAVLVMLALVGPPFAGELL